MKIEYLLIKKNNDFCSTKDQFKSLLLSNKRISMDDKSIQFSGIFLNYTLKDQEVIWNKNKEIVFYFCVSVEDANIKELEDFDHLLHRINDNCGNQFIINTIWDDVSVHYTNTLYPLVITVENLLRKLIYRFMIKTAGSAWFESTVPDSVKDSIKNTAEKNKLQDLPVEDQLLLADFIQLGFFFFEKYTTKPLNQNSIQELRKLIDREKTNDQEITAFFESYEAKSNWERYFKEKIEVEDLYEKWKKLYEYRNCVAHAKRMNGKDFNTAQMLIEELKTSFEKCLDHIDNVEMTDEEAEAVQEVAKETIRRAQKEDNVPWTVIYPGVKSGLSSLGASIKVLGNEMDYSGLGSLILQATNQEQKITNLLNDGFNSLLVREKTVPDFQIVTDKGKLVVKKTQPVGEFEIGDSGKISLKNEESRINQHE